MNTSNNKDMSSVCTVVTAFDPDSDFPERIALVKQQVHSVIIVNDAATTEIESRLTRWFAGEAGVILLNHATNRGVAAALNTGLNLALTLGFRHALLLDEDSVVSPGLVADLVASLDTVPDGESAMAGIRYLTPGKPIPSHDSSEIVEAASIITAGSLLPLSVYLRVGPFREELFIDYVDHEYCLRARTSGVRVLQCETVGMIQPVGHTLKTACGELRSVHSPFRTYYFFRNSLVVAREYFWRFPGFSVWTLWQQGKTLVKIALFLRPKRQYLRAVLRGWSDGWACRLGRIDDGIFV